MMLKEEGEMNAQTRIAIIAASTFLLIAPFSGMAQNPPDLEVSDPLWIYDANVRFSVNAFNSGIIGARGGFNSPYVVNEVSALFRNTGTKTAKSVTWEFVVFKDAQESQVLHTYTSHSDTMLAPGESVRLRKAGYFLEHSQYKRARVTQIKYTDGTIWQGAKPKR